MRPKVDPYHLGQAKAGYLLVVQHRHYHHVSMGRIMHSHRVPFYRGPCMKALAWTILMLVCIQPNNPGIMILYPAVMTPVELRRSTRPRGSIILLHPIPVLP
jgi:hypothetical protein